MDALVSAAAARHESSITGEPVPVAKRPATSLRRNRQRGRRASRSGRPHRRRYRSRPYPRHSRRGPGRQGADRAPGRPHRRHPGTVRARRRRARFCRMARFRAAAGAEPRLRRGGLGSPDRLPLCDGARDADGDPCRHRRRRGRGVLIRKRRRAGNARGARANPGLRQDGTLTAGTPVPYTGSFRTVGDGTNEHSR